LLIQWVNMPESLFGGWVNITGMVGQHKTEWWVNMLWNLQNKTLRTHCVILAVLAVNLFLLV